jgi:hypothetical protein
MPHDPRGSLYRFENVNKALNVLLRFMAKWPNAAELATKCYVGDEEVKGFEPVDMDQLAKLPAWIAGLCQPEEG